MTNPEIPAGMKPWHGGEGPPDDWDGGPVSVECSHRKAGHRVVCAPYRENWSGVDFYAQIIAYTPKAPAYPEGMTPELAERMVAIVRYCADHFGMSKQGNEARAIMAELEPVDPVETKARAIVKAHYPEAKDSYNGRRMTIAREAIKAGMELAEAKP